MLKENTRIYSKETESDGKNVCLIFSRARMISVMDILSLYEEQKHLQRIEFSQLRKMNFLPAIRFRANV